MAKETFKIKEEVGADQRPYYKVKREQMNTITFAPDIVKLTNKDMKKILNMGKKEEDD